MEFIPRMGKLGLGAAPKPQKLPEKKRIKKPGEIEIKVMGSLYEVTNQYKFRCSGVELTLQRNTVVVLANVHVHVLVHKDRHSFGGCITAVYK